MLSKKYEKESLGAPIKEWEQKIAGYFNIAQRAKTVKAASDAQLRLMCGELTAQEIRSIRAMVNYIVRATTETKSHD